MIESEQLSLSEKLNLCNTTEDIDTIVNLTKDSEPQVRLRALKNICPCRVRSDIDSFWNRVLEMTDDPDASVRYQVLHTLCDGSPQHRENEIINAIEVFNRDPDNLVRRKAHKVLASYTRTGKWNVL